MLLPDRIVRWRLALGVVAFLCVALLAFGARAAAPSPEMSASAMAPVAAQSMPMASVCMPCATCYVAPAPSAHTTTGEGKEAESATWWARDLTAPSTVRFLVTETSRVPVPIRIRLCRWLD